MLAVETKVFPGVERFEALNRSVVLETVGLDTCLTTPGVVALPVSRALDNGLFAR